MLTKNSARADPRGVREGVTDRRGAVAAIAIYRASQPPSTTSTWPLT
jgi:hypothetical protein